MASKSEIRRAVLARRDAMPAADRIERSLQAAEIAATALEFEPGTIIAGFLPIRSEIDARPLMDNLRKAGARLCLPVVVDRITIVFRELVRGEPLVETGFGTVGPGPNAEILEPQIVIAPLAAFDSAGNRLGYGAGHYDRALARLAERNAMPLLVGLAFSNQEAAEIPGEFHDYSLDGVITDEGVRWFKKRSSV